MAKQQAPAPKKNPAIALDYGKIPPQALDLEEVVVRLAAEEPGSEIEKEEDDA